MTDSASIAFEDAWEHESVALFCNEGGDKLIKLAQRFCRESKFKDEFISQEVMFMFCLWLEGKQLSGRIYFGADGNDGDNIGLGHSVINMYSGDVVRQYTP